MAALPTVASLCGSLGQHLKPAEGFAAPDTTITAVHISELQDPTSYVVGGELLLTTGLMLPTSSLGCEQYVARLLNAGVAALGLGLGPVYDVVPEPLAATCDRLGLPLLVVPAPTPFLTVTNAYWAARNRATEQPLHDAVAAQRGLIDAAVAPDPAAEILRRLARALDGWAARLTPAGSVEQIYPASMIDEAEELQAEVSRLEVAGVHSAASFVANERFVAVFPLSAETRIVGYLAVGSATHLTPHQRHVVMTAVTLLSIDALRSQRSASAREATGRAVAALIELGFVDQARQLAAVLDVPVPGAQGRVLVTRSRDSDAIARLVERWCPEVLGTRATRADGWFIIPVPHPGLDELARELRTADRSASALISEPTRLKDAATVKARLLDALGRLAPGVVDLAEGPDDTVNISEKLDRFLTEQSRPVREALVAYLRHRGQWEQASRALGVHRNTLRYRLERAREAVDLDIDDPDHAARLWLLLRSRGVA